MDPHHQYLAESNKARRLTGSQIGAALSLMLAFSSLLQAQPGPMGGLPSRGLVDAQARSQDFADRKVSYRKIAKIVYPSELAEAGIAGVVYAKVEIDDHGNVARVSLDHVEPSTATPLADSALAAAKNCTFEPARRRGKPVSSEATLAFIFQLSSGASPKVADATLDPIRIVANRPAQDDAADAENARSYASHYQTGMRLSGAQQNTPEADARPGEYYFQVGANAFLKGDVNFAIEMYRVAASWAYKPAEYNLGVIYARGQGVPADLPRALAWMTLAAERGDEPRYAEARDLVRSEMTAEQAQQTDALLKDLNKTYGDEVALRRAKARWAEVRSHITGSRVGSVGHLDIGVPTASADPSASKSPRPQGSAPGVHTIGTTSAEALQGTGTDGSIAYRQLLESDNPYDPKFERKPAGVTTVEPLVPIKPSTNGDDKASDTPSN